jgi:hypothetical protein
MIHASHTQYLLRDTGEEGEETGSGAYGDPPRQVGKYKRAPKRLHLSGQLAFWPGTGEACPEEMEEETALMTVVMAVEDEVPWARQEPVWVVAGMTAVEEASTLQCEEPKTCYG